MRYIIVVSGLVVLLPVGAVSLLGAAGPKEDPAKKEVDKLQGTWLIVGVRTDGQQQKPEDEIRIIYDGSKFRTLLGKKVTEAGTYTVDVNAKPKTIDYVIAEGDNNGKTFKCIISLKETCT